MRRFQNRSQQWKKWKNYPRAILVLWGLFGLFVADVNKRKTGGWLGGLVLGVCLGPIGLLLSLVIPYKPQQEQRGDHRHRSMLNEARHLLPKMQGMNRDGTRLGMAVVIVLGVLTVVGVALAVAT